MRLLFIGSFYSTDREKQLLKYSNVGLPNACNIFQWNIIHGLEKNLNTSIFKLTSAPIGNFPVKYKKLLIKAPNLHGQNKFYYEMGFVNFYFVKHIIKKWYAYFMMDAWLKNNIDTLNCIVLYDSYLPYLQAIKKLKKKYNCLKTCFIVADIPGDKGAEIVSGKFSRFFLKARIQKQLELLKEGDKYVLLTKEMANELQISEPNFCVIEGMVNSLDCPVLQNANHSAKKVVMYTGTLAEQYGLLNLLKAFSLIKNPDFELWICGSGEAENKIKYMASKDFRIKFYGYVTKEKIKYLQSMATLLINPRQNNGEYTKYSFPSKTLEYMLAGKPILMYPLDGVPKEYYKYVYYVENNSIESLAEKILEICIRPSEELICFGSNAREFALAKKNNFIQTKKILSLILEKEQ